LESSSIFSEIFSCSFVEQFNNKISLWIKQRLLISRNYDDTMNALEKFVDDISAFPSQLTSDSNRQIPPSVEIQSAASVLYMMNNCHIKLIQEIHENAPELEEELNQIISSNSPN